jgi:hypothetical protein
MRAEVRPVYVLGKAIPNVVREKDAPARGELTIIEKRLQSAGRVLLCAKLASTTDASGEPLLPELADARVIWLSGSSMRVCGIEKVGEVLYAQTWHIKVL